MPHYRDRVRCNAKYFAAADLGDRDVTLTISIVPDDNETMPDGESRMVIYFKEDRRGLVLNVTNGDAIAEMFGDDYSAWIGEQLTLFATETERVGKTVACIRIRRADHGRGLSSVIKAAAASHHVEPVADVEPESQCFPEEET